MTDRPSLESLYRLAFQAADYLKEPGDKKFEDILNALDKQEVDNTPHMLVDPIPTLEVLEQLLIDIAASPHTDRCYVAKSFLEQIRSTDEPVSVVVILLSNYSTHKDWYLRWLVTEALGALEAEEGIAILTKALDDPSAQVRVSAIQALSEIGDESVVQSLIRCLDDTNALVAQSAAEVLGQLNDERAIEPLVDCLDHGNIFVRQAAAESLGKIGNPKAVVGLKSVLDDEEPVVRAAGVIALSQIPTIESVIGLKDCVSDTTRPGGEDRSIGQLAWFGLEHMDIPEARFALASYMGPERS